jgi:hypothetical protein
MNYKTGYLLIVFFGLLRVVLMFFELDLDTLLGAGWLNDCIDVPVFALIISGIILRYVSKQASAEKIFLIRAGSAVGLFLFGSSLEFIQREYSGFLMEIDFPWRTYDPMDFLWFFIGCIFYITCAFSEYKEKQHKKSPS